MVMTGGWFINIECIPALFNQRTVAMAILADLAVPMGGHALFPANIITFTDTFDFCRSPEMGPCPSCQGAYCTPTKTGREEQRGWIREQTVGFPQAPWLGH